MKKSIVVIALILALISLSLYGFTKLSSAYPFANNAIIGSANVAGSFGPQRYSILIGFRSKSSSAWNCTSLTYYVYGTLGSGVVNVRIQRRNSDPWKIVEVNVGYFTPFSESCDFSSSTR